MARVLNLRFFIRYSTRPGQSIWVSGNIAELGNNDPAQAIPLSFFDNEFWSENILLKTKDLPASIHYYYFLKNEDNEIIHEGGKDRIIEFSEEKTREFLLIDTWNHAGEYENAFFTDAFQNILLHETKPGKTAKERGSYTHTLKVKAPILGKNEIPCILGGGSSLGEWSTKNPLLMKKNGNWWTVKLNLKENALPVIYKYGIYEAKKRKFLHFEKGNNRVLFSHAGKKKKTLVHDGFIHLENNTWKGAGLAIPVFSLKSKNSFGVGEFTDLKLLVDWAKAAGMKMIQLLPVNDTTTTGTWKDSYPYAAISAFALHPVYINLSRVAGKELNKDIKLLKKKQKSLNEKRELDYEGVYKIKIAVLKELYIVLKEECFTSAAFKEFFKDNKYWLEPYAAYCFFRDKSGNADFTGWGDNSVYSKPGVDNYIETDPASLHEIEFWYFVQFHLHLQLKEASSYAHKKGIVLKGDIPIGVSRHGCEVWESPELFDLNWQSGAPPDDFSIHGQNWGFPIYNWEKMQENDFDWWKRRFDHMHNYFDAFRIDHILGFFRIWAIPLYAVQGIMGRFIPANSVNIAEFGKYGLAFDYHRFTKPYINDEILQPIFGDLSSKVKQEFLKENDFDGYDLLPGFETQKEVKDHFAEEEDTDENKQLQSGLYDLISNVILFQEDLEGEHFHFRISMEQTSSFKQLNPFVKDKLRSLYTNYFYHRQEDLWAREAMHKLAPLKASTAMLVFGEDLGMVPQCVKAVMQNLGIMGLNVQRMPKYPGIEFFHPKDASYFSVVTPSTHDMSTIREWWEENKEKTQRFYINILGQMGESPPHCETWITKAILMQHLYSPAMWCIFQLQDILGLDEKLCRENPKEERINNPANAEHYWNYRMHLNLEDLLNAKEFTKELKGYITNSGR